MKFLVIQTAFIGDAILATSILEKLHEVYPNSTIDFMIRKGNEGLFIKHPFINRLYVWNKKGNKYKNLLSILKEVRKCKYDYIINLQRFASTGLFASLAKGKIITGFKKNPLSFLFNEKHEHDIDNGIHEIERNHELIKGMVGDKLSGLRLYPQTQDYASVSKFQRAEYITISPASVWYTKQYPPDKWIEYISIVKNKYLIYLLGGKGDTELCESIKDKASSNNVHVLAGKLSFLESAALMEKASMNFTNDSAPLHIASAMNAPVTSVFCSTVSDFGFTPLSDCSKVVETQENLKCRPCGLHGKKTCPISSFECAYSISVNQLQF